MENVWKNISSTSVLYILLILDFIIQLGVIVHNHGHLSEMTLFDTIFLIIVKTNEKELSWIPGKVFALNVITYFS